MKTNSVSLNYLLERSAEFDYLHLESMRWYDSQSARNANQSKRESKICYSLGLSTRTWQLPA
jgi:hypothetical protein